MKNGYFSIENPYFPFKNGDFKGGRVKWPFLLFFPCFPYVIERPASTASFSGGIGNLGQSSKQQIDNLDEMMIFSSVAWFNHFLPFLRNYG